MKPQIRFKGFTDDWERSKIGEIVQFGKGHGYSKSDLQDKGEPIVLYGHMYTQYTSVIRDIKHYATLKENSILSQGDEVIIPSSGETPEDISIASAIKLKNIIIGGDLNILRFKKQLIDPSFAAIAITNSPTHEELSKFAQGKTIVHLRNSDISKGHISYPYFEEQICLSKYIETIEEYISTIDKKISSLKQIKLACLQSMFPQEGESVPKVRFKGFNEEWRTKRLSDCLLVSHDKNIDNIYNVNDVLSVSDDYGVKNQIELLGRSYAGKSVSKYGILHKEEIVFTKSPLKTKPFGIVKMNTYKTGIVSVLYAIYKANKNISPLYIHYYFDPAWRLNKYLSPLVNKGAKNTMNISDEYALSGEIMIPSFQEQQKIAAYFENLDKQISLQTQRLEKLKQVKSACLDKMFV